MICTSVNFHFCCIPITAIPWPAFHCICHFPCRRRMGILCVINRHNCNCQILQFKGNSGICHLTKRLSCEINSAWSGTYPATAAIKTRCIILIFPCADSNLTQIILSCPDEVTNDTLITFCFLHKSVRICTEGFTSKNNSLGILL